MSARFIGHCANLLCCSGSRVPSPTDRHGQGGADGQPVALLLGGIRWPRRDFGAEVQARVREGVNGDISTLRDAALVASPPVEAPRLRKSDLRRTAVARPPIKLDIRYAADQPPVRRGPHAGVAAQSRCGGRSDALFAHHRQAGGDDRAI